MLSGRWGTRRSCGIRSARRSLRMRPVLGVAGVAAAMVHTPVHPTPTHHGAVMTVVGGREYRREDNQCGQREGPEAQILAKRPETAFRTIGQKQYEVPSDGQRRRRKQREEVNHECPLL